MQRRAFLGAGLAFARQTPARPNILWITCEDMSPILGCYGDRYAATPNLDRFAQRSALYHRAYATAPVCSPARSCLITGMYANSLGSMHLRGMVPKPASVPCFPELLRKAGYYTSNNEKEDYNFDPPQGCWDESSGKAHWRNRAKGQPFFSVFNIMDTHQGQIRYPAEELAARNAKLPAELRHDPARCPLPPYYPDTPAVRGQIAALYTQATLMDQKAGAILSQLEQDGLADNTIVFFFSDHGTGLPRGKRFLHDTGLRVPLLIRQPGQAPSANHRLVNFADFAPTVLSLAGVEPPSTMQGSAFLGPFAKPARSLAFAARDRVDEEIETSRTVFDGRWQYIRNYLPHRPVLQHGDYSEVATVWTELRRLHQSGALQGYQRLLMQDTKPVEELYDLSQDPWQLNNLASAQEHQGRKTKLRQALHTWMNTIRDTGLLPEAEMLARAAGRPPRDVPFPVDRVLQAAEGARLPAHPDAAVRYWSAVSLMAGQYNAAAARTLARDANPSVRLAASEALCRAGQLEEGLPGLREALASTDACLQLAAASALWHLGPAAAASAKPDLRSALQKKTDPAYQRTYFEWAAAKMLR